MNALRAGFYVAVVLVTGYIVGAVSVDAVSVWLEGKGL